MRTLSVSTWIGNAAAVLCGRHGAVTAQTKQAGCSRQAAYQQARRVEQAVAQVQTDGPDPTVATAELAALRQENRQLWEALEFALYRPDGRLNDRRWAEAEIHEALAALTGPLWSGVRNFVQDRRSLTFLDRLQRQLTEAEPRVELRAALVELWRLGQAGRRGCGPWLEGVGGVIDPALQALVCQGLAEDWREAYGRVSGVLSRTVRASSVVECMNSVVRMHQARHRSLSQGLLDLKRLH